MERRKFIQNTSLTMMAAVLAKNGFASSIINAKKSKKLTVGAHVWVYASTQPNYDVSPVLEQIFSDMLYAGFDAVETMEQPLRSETYTKQIVELIEKYKIGLIGTSYGADMWDKSKHSEIYEDVDLVMTNLASLGGRTFGTSVGEPHGRLKSEAELDAQAELLKRLVKLGHDKGIVLNLHNHTSEVKNNMYDLGGTLKRIPDIKLGPDLNWLLRANVDPIEFLEKYQKQIFFLHLRDQLNNGKWSEALGEGDVNFEEIGDTLKQIGFAGDVIIELAFEGGFKPTRPSKETLKISRDYLKKTTGI
ncbi:sugar phosphate isomerase/epimerase [Prolixibacteraceae bacterium Z1-6]|uniref:Sugar phosphate isomerase/epimerase n=1 Tax=Draconibacterium aestuarii TaxID=2998507 RepID=A0A9X3F9R6_9BACT|nr:sugar phosphate isomerase/epimerase [Prolixibacteraceae bacterium Z1-6]